MWVRFPPGAHIVLTKLLEIIYAKPLPKNRCYSNIGQTVARVPPSPWRSSFNELIVGVFKKRRLFYLLRVPEKASGRCERGDDNYFTEPCIVCLATCNNSCADLIVPSPTSPSICESSSKRDSPSRCSTRVSVRPFSISFCT